MAESPVVAHRETALEPKTEIVDGVEFFTVGDEEGAQCARCGSSVTSADCWQCGGSGHLQCDECKGRGFFHVCLSSAEWCKAHPLPGRENERGAHVP